MKAQLRRKQHDAGMNKDQSKVPADCLGSLRPCTVRSQPLPGAHRAVHFPSKARCTMRSSANSAQMVLPLPVGAATSALSSVLYSAVKTCKQEALISR